MTSHKPPSQDASPAVAGQEHTGARAWPILFGTLAVVLLALGTWSHAQVSAGLWHLGGLSAVSQEASAVPRIRQATPAIERSPAPGAVGSD